VKATLKNGSWSFEELPFVGFFNASDYQDFHYDFKYNIIISAIQKSDSKGGQDLHYSLWDEEEKAYTTPINMGSVINSDKDDFAPFLAADGRTLFFASYGHRSKGNADIFVSTRIGEGWDNWTSPVNLTEINTRNEETYISVSSDFNTLYYDSYPSGSTKRNLLFGALPETYRPKVIERPLIAETKEIVPAVAEIKEEPKNDEIEEVKEESPSVVVSVPTPESEKKPEAAPETSPTPMEKPTETKVAAKETAPLERPEAVMVTKEPENEVTQPIQVNENINPEVVDTDAERVQRLIESELSDKLIIKRRLEGGKLITRFPRNIYFEFNKATLRPEFIAYLDLIAEYMNSHKRGVLFIEGHTDATGGERVNLDLSCMRAFNVKNYLLTKGISEDRLQVECYGEERPLASNDDEVMGREYNRRVELKIGRE
jgi:OmpA-OmpF porin, OOP family